MKKETWLTSTAPDTRAKRIVDGVIAATLIYTAALVAMLGLARILWWILESFA